MTQAIKTAPASTNAVYFHNGKPTAYRQILDDLERHGVPTFARDAYVSGLRPYDPEEDAALFEGEGGWEPVKSNPSHERKISGTTSTGAPRYVYRDVRTKESVDASANEGVKGERTADSKDVKDANPRPASSEGIKTASSVDGVQSDKNRSPEAKEAQQKAADLAAPQAAAAIGDLSDKLKAQYEARGDKAAQDAIASAPGILSKVKGWAAKKVDQAITEATSWTRALVGGNSSDVDPSEQNTYEPHDAKSWLSTMVRTVTNPLIELPKIAVNRMFADAKRWGFTDHDSAKLEQKWGPKIANIVVASGAALGTAAAATGLAVGLTTASPLVAVAGAGAAALCHYCPGFRAWIARAPAKILLTLLNKTGVVDTKEERAAAKTAAAARKGQGDAKAKEDFDAKAKAAGFAASADADPDAKGKDLSPEKILEIAKEFWEGVYAKFWKKFLADKKIQKAMTAIAKAQHADPAALAMAFAEVNGKAKMPKGKAADFALHAEECDFLPYDVPAKQRYKLDGRLVGFSKARRKLSLAGVPLEHLDASLAALVAAD